MDGLTRRDALTLMAAGGLLMAGGGGRAGNPGVREAAPRPARPPDPWVLRDGQWVRPWHCFFHKKGVALELPANLIADDLLLAAARLREEWGEHDVWVRGGGVDMTIPEFLAEMEGWGLEPNALIRHHIMPALGRRPGDPQWGWEFAGAPSTPVLPGEPMRSACVQFVAVPKAP